MTDQSKPTYKRCADHSHRQLIPGIDPEVPDTKLAAYDGQFIEDGPALPTPGAAYGEGYDNGHAAGIQAGLGLATAHIDAYLRSMRGVGQLTTGQLQTLAREIANLHAEA